MAEDRPSARRDRSAELRATIEPLAPGERPTVVTAATAVAATLALANVIAFLAGLEVGGERPDPVQIAVPTLLMGAAAIGMWQLRYWAVLGFQALLGILIVLLAVWLVGAGSWPVALAIVVAITPAVVLFWKLVRIMARIQAGDPSRLQSGE